MLQLLQETPAFLRDDLSVLEREWQRFADGNVIFEQLETALRGTFAGIAETLLQSEETDEETDDHFDKLKPFLPSGPGKLYITAQ